MAFEKNSAYEKRIEFKNGANASVFEFPKGNYFAGMDLDINLDINIATGAMVTPEQHQVARMIEELALYRDGDNVVWQLPGEDLARLFRYREGVEAAGNASIAVAVANDVAGRMFLSIPFHPLDAPKPSDFAMDTTKHKYELKIKFRNIKIDGGLFANTSAGAITLNDAGCYIDLTLHKLTPVVGPTGKADAYMVTPPYFPGLVSSVTTITADKPDQEIELPENKVIRAVTLFANAESASGSNPVGSNAVFTDRITLKNTQGRTIQSLKAETLRELTSLKRRQNSLEAGLYDIDFTQYGNIIDSLLSDGVAPLKFTAAVAKQTYTTRVTSIVQTIEQQGGV